MGQIILRLGMKIRKAVQGRSCLHATGSLREIQSARPMALDGHKAACGQWAFCSWARTDVHSGAPGNCIWAPEGGSKVPFTHVPPSSIPDLWAQPQSRRRACGICQSKQGSALSIAKANPRKKEELGVQDAPRTPDPFPLGMRPRWCSRQFLLLASHGEATSSGLILGTQTRETTSESQISAWAPRENFQQPDKRQMSKRVRNNPIDQGKNLVQQFVMEPYNWHCRRTTWVSLGLELGALCLVGGGVR